MTIYRMSAPRCGRAVAPLLLTLALGACAGAATPSTPAPEEAPRRTVAETPPVQRDRRYVVVDVIKNELRYMDGDSVLWSAPVGTGTGFRLQKDSMSWDFTTPSGTMYVQYKERNPVWEVPDWYFIENKLPIPPANSPLRKQPGGLGAAAVYLGNEIAIHGTDREELLGKRVSHGCIRLANINAVRLYHEVQIGTPVIIEGEQRVVGEMPDSAAVFTRPKSAGKTRIWVNPLTRLSTDRLLRRLDRDLVATDTSRAWILSANALIERGLADDSLALRGVLARAGKATPEARRKEFDAFLADVYARGSLRATVSLSKIGEEARTRAAEAIVATTMALYHGPLGAPVAPWPTRRVPKWRLGPLGQNGWTALAKAEARFRAVPRTDDATTAAAAAR